MKSTWGHILHTIEHGSKLPIWLLTFGISLLPIYFLPNLKVTALWIAPAGLVQLFLIWVLFRAVSSALEKANVNQLPTVVSVHTENPDECILLLTASKLFGQGIRVSIYYETESGFEVRIGNGFVRNIQDNGLIQISVQSWEEAHSALSNRIMAQEKEAFVRTSVKPAAEEARPGRDAVLERRLLMSLLREMSSRRNEPESEIDSEGTGDE